MKLFNGNKPKSRAKQDRIQGQAMLEFALSLPVVLLIILGIIEVARLIFMQSAIITASREAARYGSVVGIIEGNPDAYHYQDCAGIIQTAQDVAFLVDPNNLVITIEYDSGSGTSIFDTCVDTDGDEIDAGIDVEPFEVDDPDSSDPEDTILIPKRITVTASTTFELLVPILPQLTIENIESTSSRTFLGTIEYWP